MGDQCSTQSDGIQLQQRREKKSPPSSFSSEASGTVTLSTQTIAAADKKMSVPSLNTPSLSSQAEANMHLSSGAAALATSLKAAITEQEKMVGNADKQMFFKKTNMMMIIMNTLYYNELNYF